MQESATQNPETIWDGAMALDLLRSTERSLPLEVRPEHITSDLAGWLKDRRSELSAWEKAKAESALHELERLVGSIKTRLSAKAGEIGSRRIAIVHED